MRTDAFLRGQLRPNHGHPFLPRKDPPATRAFQDNPGQSSTTWHILLHPQDRSDTLEDTQPKTLANVSITYPVRRGDLPSPCFPPMVRVLVHSHLVHIDRLLTPSGAGSRGICPNQTP